MSKTVASGIVGLAILLISAPAGRAVGTDADVVIEWNQLLQTTLPATIGPTSPRYYAMLHIAMFDAINAVERDYEPYRVRLHHASSGSPEAAAAQAAHDVLSGLFPASKPTYDAALAQRLGTHQSNFVRRGAALGAVVAEQILAWRQNDGWSDPPPVYVLPPFPGLWQSTPPNFPVAVLTHAGSVMPSRW